MVIAVLYVDISVPSHGRFTIKEHISVELVTCGSGKGCVAINITPVICIYSIIHFDCNTHADVWFPRNARTHCCRW